MRSTRDITLLDVQLLKLHDYECYLITRRVNQCILLSRKLQFDNTLLSANYSTTWKLTLIIH